MKKTLSAQEALHRAAALCSQNEQCESDIMDKLERWGIYKSDREKIIAYLIDEKYIDQVRYANAFVKDKLRYNKWGRIKIAYALKQKQIPDTIIQESIATVEEEEYISILKSIIEGKMRTIDSNDTLYERNGKLFRFAASRGFESSYISKQLKCNDLYGDD